MAELKPWEIYHEPVGSVEELKAGNFSLAHFGSCSQRGPNNVGCYAWGMCDLSCKGTRPHYFGVRISKPASNGGHTLEVQRKCTYIVTKRDAMAKNDTVMRIVAREGEEITMRGFAPDADGIKKLESDPLARVRYKPFEKQVVIDKFPDPRERTDLRELAYSAKMQKIERGERDLMMEALRASDEITEHMDLRHLYGKPHQGGTGADGAGGEGASGTPAEVGLAQGAPKRPPR